MIFNSKESRVANIKEFYELDSVRTGTVTIGIGLAIRPSGGNDTPFHVFKETYTGMVFNTRYQYLDVALTAYKRFVDLELAEVEAEEKKREKEEARSDPRAHFGGRKLLVGFGRVGGYEIRTQYEPKWPIGEVEPLPPFETVVTYNGGVVERYRSGTKSEAIDLHHKVTEGYFNEKDQYIKEAQLQEGY